MFNKTAMIHQKDLWYAAGNVDGDGSLGIYGSKKNRHGDGTFTFSMGKAEMSLHLLKRLQNQFGGRVQKNCDAHDRYQASYSWVKTGQDAVDFCKLIKDFVQLKKPQFELGSTYYARPTSGYSFDMINEENELLTFDSLTDLTKPDSFGLTFRKAKAWVLKGVYPDEVKNKTWKITLIDKHKISDAKLSIKYQLESMKHVAHRSIPNHLPEPYLAGIFDAEGLVSVADLNGIKISLPQKHRAICDRLKNQYNGGITKGKAVYNWYVSNRKDAMKFINDILPYSIEKKPQLELVKNMPVNGAPQVAKDLRKYKGNQGKEPVEKELRKPKKKLQGLPQYISQVKNSKKEVVGYIIQYKGKKARFAMQEKTLEENLMIAKEFLHNVVTGEDVQYPEHKQRDLPTYIYQRKRNGIQTGYFVCYKKGSSKNFEDSAKCMHQLLEEARAYLSTIS